MSGVFKISGYQLAGVPTRRLAYNKALPAGREIHDCGRTAIPCTTLVRLREASRCPNQNLAVT